MWGLFIEGVVCLNVNEVFFFLFFEGVVNGDLLRVDVFFGFMFCVVVVVVGWI